MKKYRYFLFDLDGTLTDPGLGITNSVMYALKKYNIAVEDRSELHRFIGPPLIDSFQKYYGFSAEDAKQAVAFYREYYSVTGIFENQVYDGIESLLADLKDAGGKILLATSKPEFFAKKILEHYGLANYFDLVAGATMDETRTEKEDVIRYAMSEFSIVDPAEVLMVGDRKYDVIGARKLGVDCVGVLFGYGSREEMEEACPVAIAESVAQLREILLATDSDGII